MRSEWVEPDVLELLLTAMTPRTRLAMRMALSSGLRIGDIVQLRTADMKQRMTIKEDKTGKSRRVYWPTDLYKQMMEQAGEVWLLPSRVHGKHISRTTVYKELRRVTELYRLDGRRISAHISPHTARKCWAVSRYQQTCDLNLVQAEMGHSSPAVTMLYAMADKLSGGGKRKPQQRTVLTADNSSSRGGGKVGSL